MEHHPKPITGLEALYRALQMQDSYEALTLKLLPSGQLGVRAPRVFEGLGRSLLLLTEAGSCQWRCQGGDHIVENLLRRYVNYAFGAIRLTCLGLHDEALALVRSLAEVGNLLQLFSLSNVHLENWRQADTKQKLKTFAPVRVRLQIEQAGQQPIVGEDTYARLCEMGIHVSPTSIYTSHELGGQLHIGGNFSVPGFLLVINQMAHLIAPVLGLVGKLIDAPLNKDRELGEAYQELREAVSWICVDNYHNFFDRFRVKQTKELVQQEISQIAEGEFQTISQAAIEELTALGELPEDLSNINLEELQDKVFTQIYRRLSQQRMNKQYEQDSAWLMQSAGAALIEDILQKAATYGIKCELSGGVPVVFKPKTTGTPTP